MIPVFLYLVLGAHGLPVFHNGIGGLGILLGPTGGYLIGFIFAAFIVGIAYEKRSRLLRVSCLAVATLAIYVFGVAWLMVSLRLDIIPAVIAGVVPFITGDTIKAGAAYLIAQRLP